jgi:competence/damage-inducible protein CinA-like protein
MAVTGGARVVVVGGGPLGAELDADVRVLVLALEGAGVPVASRTLVEPDEAGCEQALAPGQPLTVIVAGAGGSEGDLIRRVVARVAGARLVLNDRALALLEARYRRVDRPLPRAAERQALLPQGATVWETADGEPAWALESAQGIVVVLPRGANPESTIMRDLVPFLQPRWPALGTTLVGVLRTAGVTAADVEERLADRLAKPLTAPSGGEASATVLSVDGEACVRVQARAATAEAAAVALTSATATLAEMLGPDCYGRDGEQLEQVVGRLLLERGLTLSVAESCTGGLVSDRVTNIPGSSAYFERGVVVYSNRSKQELLGVPEAVLRAHGAVSALCAEAMVRGICERTGSGCGLAITGLAGPEGGTPTKPVGTVFIGVSVGGAVEAKRFLFLGDRRAVKWHSAQTALDLLRRRLLALSSER